MNKDELLRELSAKIKPGEISSKEIIDQAGLKSTPQHVTDGRIEKSTRLSQIIDYLTQYKNRYSQDQLVEQLRDAGYGEEEIDTAIIQVYNASEASTSVVTKILYTVGATVVVVGVIIFSSQIWDDIGSFGHIVITLVLGVLIAVIGSTLLKRKPESNIGVVFHFMGGMLIPGGIIVALSEFDIGAGWIMTIAFSIIFIVYLFLTVAHRHAILTFFAIANGTVMSYLFIEAIIGGPFNGLFEIKAIYQYATMAIGASYLLLAHAFRTGWNQRLSGVLRFFGSIGFLAATFSQVFDAVLWQLLYPVIIIGALFLAANMKSRSIFFASALFLVIYVSYITDKYFADSLGWPISLVILGFVFIGLGYGFVTINKKYI